MALTTESLERKTLSELSNIIRRNWDKVWYGAEPYLEAMSRIKGMEDFVGHDSGFLIVRYFLSNARYWKGDVAAAVKVELNRRLGTE